MSLNHTKYYNPDKEKAQMKAYRDNNVEELKAYRENYNKENALKVMLSKARWRARQAEIPFNITENDISIPEFCPVLGIPLQQGKLSHSGNSPSLDRIIPELGYVRGNVRVISWRANRIKSDATLEEIKAIASYMEKERDGR